MEKKVEKVSAQEIAENDDFSLLIDSVYDAVDKEVDTLTDEELAQESDRELQELQSLEESDGNAGSSKYDGTAVYLSSVRRMSMSNAEALPMFQKMQALNEGSERDAIREKLICGFLRWSASIAFKYIGGNWARLDDYIQIASVGLMDAVDHFNCEKSNSFTSYARLSVKTALRRRGVQDAIRNGFVGCPKLEGKLAKQKAEFFMRNSLTVSTVKNEDGEENDAYDTIVSNTPSAREHLMSKEDEVRLNNAILEICSQREREAIELHHTLDEFGNPMSWVEVGEKMGCRPQTASFYYENAKAKLKSYFSNED